MTFRADLYYRITVVAIFVPPLRDRRSDIPLLANEFLRRFNHDNKTSRMLSHSAIDVLMSCYFPGNVRELENCVRRTATMAQGDMIQDHDFACRNDRCLSSVLWKLPETVVPNMMVPLPVLPQPTRSGAALPTAASPTAALPTAASPAVVTPPAKLPVPPPKPPAASLPDASAEDDGVADSQIVECGALLAAMEKSGWVKAKAARLLGVTPRQVGYAIRKHGIQIQRF